MKELISNLRSILFGIAVFIAIIFVTLIFLMGGFWVLNKILPYLPIILWLVFIINIFIFLPLSIPNSTKAVAGIAFYFSSYVYGLNLWIWAFIITLTSWGIWGVIIGFVIAGIGFVPLAIIALVINGEWLVIGQLLLLIILTYGSRIVALYLIDKYEETKDERVLDFFEKFINNKEATEDKLEAKYVNSTEVLDKTHIERKDLSNISKILLDHLEKGQKIWIDDILRQTSEFNSMKNIFKINPRPLDGKSLAAVRAYQITLCEFFINHYKYLLGKEKDIFVEIMFDQMLYNFTKNEIDDFFYYYGNIEAKFRDTTSGVLAITPEILMNVLMDHFTLKENPLIEKLILDKSLFYFQKLIEGTIAFLFEDEQTAQQIVSWLHDWVEHYFKWIENFDQSKEI